MMRHYFKRVICLYIRKGFPTLSEALKNHPGTKTHERASYKDDVRKYPFSKSITPARRTHLFKAFSPHADKISRNLEKIPGTKTQWPEEIDRNGLSAGFIHPSGKVTHIPITGDNYHYDHYDISKMGMKRTRAKGHVIEHGFTRYSRASHDNKLCPISIEHYGQTKAQRDSVESLQSNRFLVEEEHRHGEPNSLSEQD